jgi:hypothetical protein
MEFSLLYEKIDKCKKLNYGFCMFRKLNIFSMWIVEKDILFDKKEFKKDLRKRGYKVVSDFSFFVVEWT